MQGRGKDSEQDPKKGRPHRRLLYVRCGIADVGDHETRPSQNISPWPRAPVRHIVGIPLGAVAYLIPAAQHLNDPMGRGDALRQTEGDHIPCPQRLLPEFLHIEDGTCGICRLHGAGQHPVGLHPQKPHEEHPRHKQNQKSCEQIPNTFADSAHFFFPPV